MISKFIATEAYVSKFTVSDLQQFIGGMLFGLEGVNDLSELSTCLKSSNGIDETLSAALVHF